MASPTTPTQEGGPAHRRVRRRPRPIVIVLAVVLVALIAVVVAVATGGNSPAPPKAASSHHAATTTTATRTLTEATAAALSPAKAQAVADQRAAGRHCPTALHHRVNKLKWSAAPQVTVDPTKTYTADIETSAGAVDVQLDAKDAPAAVSSFIFLVDHQYYTCVAFDQVVPNKFAVTGDPTATTTGGPGYTVPAENVPATYGPGDVALVKSSAGANGGQLLFDIQKGQAHISSASSLIGQVSGGLFVLQSVGHYGNSTPGKNGQTPSVVYRILKITVTSTTITPSTAS